MLRRNGILQAQASNVADPASVTVKAVIAVDSKRPTGTPNWGQLPRKPLRFWLPHSIDINTEPPHSLEVPTVLATTARIICLRRSSGERDTTEAESTVFAIFTPPADARLSLRYLNLYHFLGKFARPRCLPCRLGLPDWGRRRPVP